MINKGSYSSLSSKIDNNLLSNPMNFNSVENRNEILLKISEDSDKKYNNNAITLRNIHKTYLIGIEGVPALRGVSLKIQKGEFLIIFGTSGGGKTTMLNIIGTIDTPSRGDVTIENKIIKSNTTDEELSAIRLDKIAFVFQSFNLFPNLNVLENVEIPMKIKGVLSSSERRSRALNLLTKVGLQNRLGHFPNQLSGGEQQRVTIARALANNPEILLLDEPTGDLDTKNADIVMNILMELNLKEGITMIMVTHDVGLKNYAHRVVKVVDGKINNEFLVDVKDREECVRNLFERLDKKLGIREGVNSNNILKNKDEEEEKNEQKNSKTVYRKIDDYPIKRFKLQNNNNNNI